MKVLGVPAYIWRRLCAINLVMIVLLSVIALRLPGAGAAAQSFNDGGQGCSVSLVAPAFNQAFTINGNTATTTVRVEGGANCRETVSLASWNAAIGSSGFVGQRFFMGKTFSNLGPGMHTLSIPVNNSCTFQVDVLLGSNQVSGHGNAQYAPSVLMGFTQVRGAVCQAAQQPTPQPPAPQPPAQQPANVCSGNVSTSGTSSAGNCSTNTTVVQQTTQQQQVASQPTSTPVTATQSSTQTAAPATQTASQSITPAPAAQTAVQTTPAAAPVQTTAAPASLVNTGPGSLAAFAGIFVATSTAGTIAYSFFQRRFLSPEL